MVSVKSKGDFKNTYRFLKKAKHMSPTEILRKYGEAGVAALMEATPKDTGLTSESWRYELFKEGNIYSLGFYNSNIQNGIRIAVILDLGHGTNNGGYVQGRNYIKPAIRPIFDQIAASAWKEVTDA